jgi:hypothetical protein
MGRLMRFCEWIHLGQGWQLLEACFGCKDSNLKVLLTMKLGGGMPLVPQFHFIILGVTGDTNFAVSNFLRVSQAHIFTLAGICKIHCWGYSHFLGIGRQWNPLVAWISLWFPVHFIHILGFMTRSFSPKTTS